MTTTTFLDELTARGVLIEPDGDRLKLAAPPGVLQPRVLDAIRNHKAELLALLQAGGLAGTQSTLQAPAAPDVSELAFAKARRREWLEAARRGVYASDLYDPQAAREYARSDQSLTPEQRANLLAYADAFEAKASGAANAEAF